MKEALDFLRDNNEIAFATLGEGNRPQLRVFQIMKIEGTTLWFATSPHKRVYAELQIPPWKYSRKREYLRPCEQ